MNTYRIEVEFADEVEDFKAEMIADKILGHALYTNNVKRGFKHIVNSKIEKITCFTTRPDTLFGFSFLALSVDHPLSKFFEDDPKFKEFK